MTNPVPHDLSQRMAAVQLLLMDVDGVLTDGGVAWTSAGSEHQTFHIRDGLGIKLWQRAGGEVGLVTGRRSAAVQKRAEELGIGILRQGIDDKLAAVGEILERLGVSWQQTAFIGDDLPDLPVLIRCGVGVAVADACPDVAAAATLVTRLPGGRGAVREVIEQLLRARGAWGAIVAHFSTGG
jgi:3-deoxy-D-manno-octulosonate 8-phosphate phosphatase (KDO 8-P phosphatase)